MKKFYTWKDIETELRLHRLEWPEGWNAINVYSDCIEIFTDLKKEEDYFWTQLFGKMYQAGERCLVLPFNGQKLEIIYECDPDLWPGRRRIKPLFKSIYTSQDVKADLPVDELPGKPVLAFHSYKGGVGRTLSVISFAKEITEKFAGNKKLLIIDADIEAPGLTWMAEEQKNINEISYLDILSLIYSDSVTEELIKNIGQIVEKSILTIEAETYSAQHYFIPVYREWIQLLNIYASPEKILDVDQNKYMLAEFFSRLGEALHVDAVLMDLRAGISEYSAPFIFDPRVKRFFVSSTSRQSVMGVGLILQQVMEHYREGDNIPQILLTMIPPSDALDEEKRTEIQKKLAEPILHKTIEEMEAGEGDRLGGSFISSFEFESGLIHLEGISHVCDKLKNTKMSQGTARIVEEMFGADRPRNGKEELDKERTRSVLKRLHCIAKDEIVAEGSLSSNMLCTDVIQRIERNYRREIPRLVVLGAKGSGKTYLYKQLLIKKEWGAFIQSINQQSQIAENRDTYIIPVLASEDRKELIKPLMDCISNAQNRLNEVEILGNIYSENEDKIKAYKAEDHGEVEWKNFWRSLLLETMGVTGDFSDLEEILQRQRKRVVFILDGIENIFNENPLERNSMIAINSLIRGILNDINELSLGNIGIIIFFRKDLAEDALSTNWVQFSSQYAQFELSWSQTEALRLALWLAIQADESLYPGMPVMNVSGEIIEQQLNRLWGMKLGKDDSKEAYSSRWITAALSDFNGQLQARDIVRFLMFATENYASVELKYPDRYIMPAEVRNAISFCSDEKVKEIRQEIRSLIGVFEKLENLEEEVKILPLDMEKIPLESREIAALMKQGYLRIYKEQYYLPEIIRLHFGFKYLTGARPKVLALLKK